MYIFLGRENRSGVGALERFNFYLLKNAVLNVTIQMLPPLYWYGEGVYSVEVFVSFIVAVTAGVVCHLVCKWLDGDQ